MKKRLFYVAVAVFLAACYIVAGSVAVMAKAKPIVIAVPTSLYALEGRESLKAVMLAVGEINKAGGVMVGKVKRPFKVVSIDLRDSAPGVPVAEALLGLEKIITRQKPHAIVVGPFRSEAMLAGMDLIAKYKVPTLGTIAMAPGLLKKVAKNPKKYKYIFRVSINAVHLVKYLVGSMMMIKKKFGFNKVYFMNQDVAWARGTAKITAKILKKLGWTIAGMEAYPTGAQNFSAGLLKARMKKTDVIMPIFDMPQSGILLKQWRSMKVPALMVGFISPMAGSAAWKTFKGRIAYLMCAVFEVGNIPAKKVPASVKFYNAYAKKYGKPLQSGHGPAPSYASVYMLKAAIEKAGSLDPDKVVAALQAGVMKNSPSGVLRFNKINQAIYTTDPTKAGVASMFQWTPGGKRRIVYPASIAEGPVLLPPWMKKK